MNRFVNVLGALGVKHGAVQVLVTTDAQYLRKIASIRTLLPELRHAR